MSLFREVCSAFIVGMILLQSVCAYAAPPEWWTIRQVLNPNEPGDDYVALNQGQLKNFVRAAIYELHDKLPGGAGNTLYNLLSTWRTQKLNSDDYAVVTVGQLKAVAKPVYEAMQAAGVPIPVPWSTLAADKDDYTAANVGQAKAVFAFAVPNLVTLGRVDTDADGFSDAVEQAMGTDPTSSSSKPAGTGDVLPSGDPNTGGGGLPPYVDPYADIPWPEFDGTADADLDSDGDTVPDVKDRVPYDRGFSDARTGMPHYNIVDMGKCESYGDMADNGALFWKTSAASSVPLTYKVWTPQHPEAVTVTWDPYGADYLGLDNVEGYADFNGGRINEDGVIVSNAVFNDHLSGGYYERRLFLYHPDEEGGSAEWLPRPLPLEEDRGDSDVELLTSRFGPLGGIYGVTSFRRGPPGTEQYYTSFFTFAGGQMSFLDTQLKTDVPALPVDPPPYNATLTAPDSLGENIGNSVSIRHSLVDYRSTGLFRVTTSESHPFYKRVVAAPSGNSGDRAWLGAADLTTYVNYTGTWELVTPTQTHQIKVVDLKDENDALHPGTAQAQSRWSFSGVSPAEPPWFIGSKLESTPPSSQTWVKRSWVYRPTGPGPYEPVAIYAGKNDYAAGKPIPTILHLTAQGQAFVVGDFDNDDSVVSSQTGLWADGEVQLIDKVISGYADYTNWIIRDVSRDGMVAATAKKQVAGATETHILLLIPITTREVLADGTIRSAGGGVQASMPSPVFCGTVNSSGAPSGQMTCKLENPHVRADGTLVGDLRVKAMIASRACDHVSGELGKIKQVQLWVNGSESPQTVIEIDSSSIKTNSGPPQRPFPFTGIIPTDTVIADVPLTEGVNTFKFTAEDPVYHLVGYSLWSATINVIDPVSDDDFEITAGQTGTFALHVQMPSAALVPGTADTVQVFMNLDGAVHSNVSLTETAAASGVFAGTLPQPDGRPVRLTLDDVLTASATAQDDLRATLLVGPPGSAQSYRTGLQETDRASGLFIGGYSDLVTSGGGTGGEDSGGGTTGSDPENTGGSGNGGNPPAMPAGLAPVATVADVPEDPYDGTQQAEASNGGEYHGYAITIGVPPELEGNFKIEFGEDEYELMQHQQSGLMMLKTPGHAELDVPFTASFMPHLDPEMEDPPAGTAEEPDADEEEYQKRLDELEDASFAKGFAWGLGYGGLDMVKSTGETIVGAAKFVGRGAMQVGLRFKRAFNWISGQDNTETDEMIAEVDAAQGEVVNQGLQVGKFLGTLLLDTAAVLPKIEIGLLTGDMALIETALHGSETHRKVFAMVSEVLTQTVTDLTGDKRSAGQKGYIIGKIVFEVVSFIIPQTKLGKMMEMTKSKLLGKLIEKTNKVGSKLLKQGANLVAGFTKTAVDASKMCFVAGTIVKTSSGEMKIEQVHPGTIVWSRDEATQQEGWKRVLRTITTHPTELYRLTYELRGPPATGGRTEATETLGVTAPHPFWVCNRSHPGFVMAEDLREGDELLTATGCQAVVTGKVLEQASASGTFTTYNFEVEDFHTYFAGRSAVWVHNESTPFCQLARAGMEALRKQSGDAWEALRGSLAQFSHGDLSPRARLRIYNETRQKYLNGEWSGGTPPWETLTAQPNIRLVRGGQIDPIESAAQMAGKAGSSKKLGENLLATGIEAPWSKGNSNVAAHHIVLAGENRFPSARETREILAEAGIDINEAANGVFLPMKAEFSDVGKAVHRGSHPKAYSDWVLNRLEPHAGNAAALREELQKIAVYLVDNGWP